MTPLENLIDAAWDALEFLEDQADVVDGDYGAQEPNRAMILATVLKNAIDTASNPR